jgi:putative nucleotidyltransferase with HDIG domain
LGKHQTAFPSGFLQGDQVFSCISDADPMAVRIATTRRAPGSERWLPPAVVATTFVVVLPAVLVTLLVPSGSVVQMLLSLVLGMALSLLAATVGGAIWSRLPGSQDRVFADLMLWGWLRRSIAERRLAQAEKLLGSDPQHSASVEALTSLSDLLEARDARTYGHSQRVTRHAERIAAAMGLPAAEVAKVRTAAALHDIGKLHTPRAILNKPGRLTDSEFALIKRHPVDGAAMASGIGDPEIVAMIRHHHERLDGRGYPDALTGEAIPLGARIISVADTFDAITSNRTYRRAAHHKRALDVLAAEAGKQLDGDAVAAFRGYYRGHRTVALSALVASAPQRFLAWLGGASPAIGAGAAGAAALLVGLGNPQPAVYSPEPSASVPGIQAHSAAPKRASAVEAQAARDRRAAAPAERRTAARRDPARRGDTPTRRVSSPPAGGGTPVSGSPGGSGGGSTGGGGGGAQPPSTPRPPGGTQPTVPGVHVPGTKVPSVNVPSVQVPEVKTPEIKLPGVTVPEIKTPAINTPEIKTPEVDVPGVDVPPIKTPDLPKLP